MGFFDKLFKNHEIINKKQFSEKDNDKEEYCTNCGKRINSMAEKCPYCNFNFSTHKIENIKDVNPEKNKKPLTSDELILEIKRKQYLKEKEEKEEKDNKKREEEYLKQKQELSDSWAELQQEVVDTVEKAYNMTPEERKQHFKDNAQEMIDFDKQQKQYEEEEKIFEKQFQANQKAMQIEEKEGIEKAIPYYEKVIKMGFDGSYPFDTLVNYYRDNLLYDDEIRICEIAIKNLHDSYKIPRFQNHLDQAKLLKIKGSYESFTNEEKLNLLKRYDLYNYVSEEFKKLNKEKDMEGLNELLPLLNKCLEYNLSDNTYARVYRMLGEINLLNDNTGDALKYFEQALILNPKVGVKRKYLKLKKEVGK